MESPKVNWVDWHVPYEDPHSALSKRLEEIKKNIRSFLEENNKAPLRVMSLCAGQGRDLLDILEQMSEMRETRCVLIENDPLNVRFANNRVRELALVNTEVRCLDAGNSDSYAGATPADLLLLCGVFGNINDHDVIKTIEYLPKICAEGATVIWTRSRRHPDFTPKIRKSFGENGFREKSFVAPEGVLFSVGVVTFAGEPEPLTRGEQLFTFI